MKTLKYFKDNIDIKLEHILMDRPKNPSLGDIYTNVAMVFAKQLGITPTVLAERICNELRKNENIASANIAGYGFINITIKNNFWRSIITEIIKSGTQFSYTENSLDSTESNRVKMNIEFVSANPTGPLHTGHARNAVFGSVAANLLEKIGYDVTREFYINDQGNQIKHLAQSVYLRYIQLLGEAVSDDQFTSDMYCGSYIKDLAQEVLEKYGNQFIDKDETIWMDALCEFSINRMMQNIKQDLKDLGIIMDVYTSEAELCKKGLVNEALDILNKHGDIYEGILPKPKGISNEDWEEHSQLLFKSTKYGDDIDRAIRKSDGTWTYFAGDLAYHLDKVKRGFTHMLGILGADHNGYIKRLKAAVDALSEGKASIDIRLYQLVNFFENGQLVRMSKRKGNFITLRDVINRVGKDITRFMMVSRHHDVMIDFDFVKVAELSMENPLFYIQYAHARICSVFRYYREIFGDISDSELINIDKSILSDSSEIDLIKVLSFWPEQVKAAAIAIEPHRIPSHLRDIAASFHSLWNRGKMNDALRFIDRNNKNTTLARLSLLRAAQIVLVDGLEILGITPLTEMESFGSK